LIKLDSSAQRRDAEALAKIFLQAGFMKNKKQLNLGIDIA
jgi:hypothetical protein